MGEEIIGGIYSAESISYIQYIIKKDKMTVEQLSEKELTLLSSLVKQNKSKLEEIIRGASKVNDVRTKRLTEIVELAMSLIK